MPNFFITSKGVDYTIKHGTYERNEPIIFEVKNTYIPFGVTKYKKKKYISININSFTIINKIEELEKFIMDYNRVNVNKIKSNIKKSIFSSSVTKNDFGYTMKLTYDENPFEDQNGNELDENAIANIYGISHIKLDKIWMFNKKIGFKWNLICFIKDSSFKLN